MAYLNDLVFDQGLNWAIANGTRVDICSAEPANYAAVAGVSLGNKTGVTIGAAQDGDVDGRKAVVPALTAGTVTGSGTATHYAITDGASLLVATGTITSQSVTSGNTFTLAEIDLAIADATQA